MQHLTGPLQSTCYTLTYLETHVCMTSLVQQKITCLIALTFRPLAKDPVTIHFLLQMDIVLGSIDTSLHVFSGFTFYPDIQPCQSGFEQATCPLHQSALPLAHFAVFLMCISASALSDKALPQISDKIPRDLSDQCGFRLHRRPQGQCVQLAHATAARQGFSLHVEAKVSA